MTLENTYYSGFFLGNLPNLDPDSDRSIIKVACFKVGTQFRSVLELSSNIKCSTDYGSIIHLSSRDEELKDKSIVELKEQTEQIFIHETEITDQITYTMKDFVVGAEDLCQLNVYRNPDLGDMIDEQSIIQPGHYNFITFQVILKDNDFSINIVGGQRMENDFENQEIVTDAENFENIHELIEIEHEFNKKADTESWAAIGCLKLVAYDSNDIDGLRPIFELMDKKKKALFVKQSNNCEVVMIKQKKVEKKWVDDDSKDPQLGTLFPDDNLNRTMAKLKADHRHVFEQVFNVNDVFRFESGLVDRTANYWKDQKQETSGIFKESLMDNSNSHKLQDVIDSHMIDPKEFKSKKFKDDNTTRCDLNESQFRAIKMALNENRKLVCIQGPPGTGKTFVLSLLLAKLVGNKKQAIVLTPTKEALKNIREMTQKAMEKSDITFYEHTLMDVEKLSAAINNTPVALNALEEQEKFRKEIAAKTISIEEGQKILKELTKSAKFGQGRAIMKKVSVVFATISSSFVHEVMKLPTFDPCMCVIDEAAQVMETQTWPAVSKMKKIVMAGDPKQLPALVKTLEAREGNLNGSVMDRIIKNKEYFSWIMLDEQYRCHPLITRWSNTAFYESKLKSKTNEGNKLWTSFSSPPPSKYVALFEPFVFIDTSLQTDKNKRIETYEQIFYEKEPESNEKRAHTYGNYGEAKIAIRHYGHLRKLGIPAKSIAIITPYKGQVDLIKLGMNNMRAKDEYCLESMVGTVDSVQGQEYDVVIFSMVRNNPRKTMGFVSDLRRLNVVITRAKRQFFFIGNGYMIDNSRVTEIRELMSLIISSKQRLHPDLVSYIEVATINPGKLQKVSNNFGQDFGPFIDHSNDVEMKKWCREFVERGKDPVFRAKQNAKKYGIQKD